MPKGQKKQNRVKRQERRGTVETQKHQAAIEVVSDIIVDDDSDFDLSKHNMEPEYTDRAEMIDNIMQRRDEIIDSIDLSVDDGNRIKSAKDLRQCYGKAEVMLQAGIAPFGLVSFNLDFTSRQFRDQAITALEVSRKVAEEHGEQAGKEDFFDRFVEILSRTPNHHISKVEKRLRSVNHVGAGGHLSGAGKKAKPLHWQIAKDLSKEIKDFWSKINDASLTYEEFRYVCNASDFPVYTGGVEEVLQAAVSKAYNRFNGVDSNNRFNSRIVREIHDDPELRKRMLKTVARYQKEKEQKAESNTVVAMAL